MNQPERSRPSWSPSAVAPVLVLALVGLSLRGWGIDQLPVDAHHVRQADTAWMARLMVEQGVDLLHPRVGWAGPLAGPVEAELPLYPALVAGVWSLGAGPLSPVVPRVLSLLAWLIGGLALLRLLRRHLSEQPPVLGLLVYAFAPLAVLQSRAIQPDALALCLWLWGLERADAARGRIGSLLLAGGLLGVGAACKAPLLFLLPAALLAAWPRDGAVSWGGLAALALPALGLPLAWMAWAHGVLGVDGAVIEDWSAGSGRWTSAAALVSAARWRAVLGMVVGGALTPVGTALAALGLGSSLQSVLGRVALAGALGTAAYALTALPAASTHTYDLTMLVPFGSVLVGLGILEARRVLAGDGTPSLRLALGAALVGALGWTAVAGPGLVRAGLQPDQRLLDTASEVTAVLPRGMAAVVVDRHPQTLMYLLDQRGWHRTALDPSDLGRLRILGAEALLVTESSATWADRDRMRDLLAPYPLVAKGEGWTLLRLDVLVDRR